MEGPKDRLGENLAALASLDYPEYELILAARRASDIPGGALPRRVNVVLGGAKGVTGSEKIQNMLAGVRASTKRSEVFALPAAEGGYRKPGCALWSRPSQSQAGAATGFYWYLPDPPDFWSLVRSVWHAPIAALLGTDNRVLWRGSLAIRKAFFFDLQVPSFGKTRRALKTSSAAPLATRACRLSSPRRHGGLPWPHRHARIFRRSEASNDHRAPALAGALA